MFYKIDIVVELSSDPSQTLPFLLLVLDLVLQKNFIGYFPLWGPLYADTKLRFSLEVSPNSWL